MGISFKPENLLVLRGKFSFITLGLVGGLINVNFLRIFTKQTFFFPQQPFDSEALVFLR